MMSKPNSQVIEWETAEGVLDFHALRTTFATMLSRAGVQLVTAQKLMRHSDPKLTANFYTRVVIQDQSAAINKLPKTTVKPAIPEKDETATEGGKNILSLPAPTKTVDTYLDTCGAESGGILRNNTENNTYKLAAGGEHENHEKSPENSGFRCVSGRCEAGAKKEIRTPDLLSHSPDVQFCNDLKIKKIQRQFIATVTPTGSFAGKAMIWTPNPTVKTLFSL